MFTEHQPLTAERLEHLLIAASEPDPIDFSWGKETILGLLATITAERAKVADAEYQGASKLEQRLWLIIDGDGPRPVPSDIVEAVDRITRGLDAERTRAEKAEALATEAFGIGVSHQDRTEKAEAERERANFGFRNLKAAYMTASATKVAAEAQRDQMAVALGNLVRRITLDDEISFISDNAADMAALDRARAALADMREASPAPEATHRHYKGGLYRVLLPATIEATMEPATVYQSHDDRAWVRTTADFEAVLPDGRRRFEPISSQGALP